MTPIFLQWVNLVMLPLSQVETKLAPETTRIHSIKHYEIRP